MYNAFSHTKSTFISLSMYRYNALDLAIKFLHTVLYVCTETLVYSPYVILPFAVTNTNNILIGPTILFILNNFHITKITKIFTIIKLYGLDHHEIYL